MQAHRQILADVVDAGLPRHVAHGAALRDAASPRQLAIGAVGHHLQLHLEAPVRAGGGAREAWPKPPDPRHPRRPKYDDRRFCVVRAMSTQLLEGGGGFCVWLTSVEAARQADPHPVCPDVLNLAHLAQRLLPANCRARNIISGLGAESGPGLRWPRAPPMMGAGRGSRGRGSEGLRTEVILRLRPRGEQRGREQECDAPHGHLGSQPAPEPTPKHLVGDEQTGGRAATPPATVLRYYDSYMPLDDRMGRAGPSWMCPTARHCLKDCPVCQL